jgi:hypothetical protein
MELAQPSSTSKDFYERSDDRRRLLLSVLIALPMILLLGWPSLNSGFWTRHILVSLGSSLFLLVVVFRLPFVVRNLLLAYRGKPALSIDDQGLWLRGLSELGWIKWSDIADVVVQASERERGSGDLLFDLGIHLHDKAYARLPWSYRLSNTAMMLMCFVVAGKSNDSRTLWLTNSRELTSSWEKFMAALDPMLAANGISKREERSN